ncbi:hypothetical protein PR202_ga28596 [Eleusine coracana subsp. coracana]|uniref:Uncharacterized protein n=1 Tax=Eleusine coracana subsp. coracana TaxID=191504 RepID=A0AAV5DHR7_ELECO|nr:hypothetical protein PR202_ga28596 [Eleusine coracana subsp. coracana]
MAETALSMASSILGSAINKAATAVAEEMSLVMGVQKEIWYIWLQFMKDELKTMQAFLIAAEAMKKKTPLLKVWAKQVRSLSYDIEDCLDEFMVHVGSQRLSRQLMKLKDHHRIAVQIRNLKSRVEEVNSRNTRYNLIQMEDTEIDQALSYLEDVRNHSARNIDEAELVGTSTFKKNLLDKINAQYDDGHDRVICVVGMGGLGKTTLVRKIYESKEGIENKFPYRAWITVSQSLSRIDVLKGAMFAAKHKSEWDRLYTQLPAQLENNLSLEAIRNMLVKLRLLGSRLKGGKAVEILGALPNLMLLHLQSEAYMGKKLVFRQGAFQNLRKLNFYTLTYEHYVEPLRGIRFEQNASPQMESIEVGAYKLKLGINGIEHLLKLKEISLGYSCKVARLGMLQEEVNAHPNKPVLRLRKDRSYHDLGDPEDSDEYFDVAESLPDHDGEDSEATTPTASATVN